jgi:hypothetical protein
VSDDVSAIRAEIDAWAAGLPVVDQFFTTRWLGRRALRRTRKHSPYHDVPVVALAGMGCPFLVNEQEPVSCAPAEASRPGLAMEVFMREILELVTPDSVYMSADLASLLGGLSRNEWWRDFCDTGAGSYLLISAILAYSEFEKPPSPNTAEIAEVNKLRLVTTPMVLDIVNGWTGTNYAVLPDPSALIRLYFGTAWATLNALVEYAPAAAVLNDRPPFLPGLCRWQDAILEFSLPNNIVSPQ